MPEETLPSPVEETPLDLKLDELALPAPTSEARQIAADNITETLPASAYINASTLLLTREQEAILDEPVPDDEINIRPDGLIYVSHEYVRRQLNRAFGRGQWAIVPGSKPVRENNELYRCWVLFVKGIYVSEALASRRYFANGNQSLDDVYEAIKSDCLRRCCKDLGIGLEAWNRRRGETWRRQHAVQVLCSTNQGNKKQWRRADADPLNNEIPGSVVKPMEGEGEKGHADPPVSGPATASQTTVAPPPPSTPPPPTTTQKPGPRAVPKPAPVKAVMRLSDGQLRLLWVRAMGAALVVGDDAEKWIGFLNENCMVPIPERAGKKSKEIAAAMMRSLPTGTHYQKLLKALEILAQQTQVEI